MDYFIVGIQPKELLVTSVDQVTYDGHVVGFRLPIKVDRRLLIVPVKQDSGTRPPTTDEVSAILAQHHSVSDDLKRFIAALFKLKAVESFSIDVPMGGPAKVTIKLSPIDDKGKVLGMDGRLANFVYHFTKLTGRSPSVVWQQSMADKTYSAAEHDTEIPFLSAMLDILTQPLTLFDTLTWLDD